VLWRAEGPLEKLVGFKLLTEAMGHVYYIWRTNKLGQGHGPMFVGLVNNTPKAPGQGTETQGA
jgi:hypothetical protein